MQVLICGPWRSTWCQVTWFAKGRRLHARFPPPTGKIPTHNYRVWYTTWVHHLGAELLWSHGSSISVTYLGAITYAPATVVCPVSMLSNFCLQYGSLCCFANTAFCFSSVLDMPLTSNGVTPASLRQCPVSVCIHVLSPRLCTISISYLVSIKTHLVKPCLLMIVHRYQTFKICMVCQNFKWQEFGLRMVLLLP